MKNNKVISNSDQVNRETGAVHTDLGYLIEGKLDDYIGKTSTGDGNTTGENNTGGGTTETPTLPSTADTKPFLPDGATQVEGTSLDTGLVIKDVNGNEWVWIEVPKSIYTFSNVNYTDIETALQNYAIDYRKSGHKDKFYSTSQHGFTDSTEYTNWKNSMLESVFTNGGFYIGRYEIGADTSTARTSSSGISTTPYIKQDMIPYNYITCSQAQTLAKQLATNGKTSSLMFGIQWDLVLKFIEIKGAKTQSELKTNSTTWGNYINATFEVTRGKYLSGSTWNNITTYLKPTSDVLLSTGATTRNSVLNIYDLAGNVSEWTLEYYSGAYPCTYRSAGYTSDGNGDIVGPAFSRYSNNSVLDSSNTIGARPALW